MVSVSPAFQAAATADERRVVGYLYKGNEKLYGGDVIQSMKITELCGGGEDLVPGVCACSEAEAWGCSPSPRWRTRTAKSP